MTIPVSRRDAEPFGITKIGKTPSGATMYRFTQCRSHFLEHREPVPFEDIYLPTLTWVNTGHEERVLSVPYSMRDDDSLHFIVVHLPHPNVCQGTTEGTVYSYKRQKYTLLTPFVARSLLENTIRWAKGGRIESPGVWEGDNEGQGSWDIEPENVEEYIEGLMHILYRYGSK